MARRSFTARFWLVAGLFLLGGAIASYFPYRESVPLTHGGTPMGIAYGIAALVLIFVLLAFGLRKRSYRVPVGTLEGWFHAHVYLGLLSAVVVALHAGFRFHDRVATASYAVLLAVVATGIVGVFLYTSLPARLTRVESNLTAEQISEELHQLAESMTRIAAGRSENFRKIHQRLVREARPSVLAGWRLVFFGAGKDTERDWEPVVALLGDDEREPLRKLLMLSRQHRELHDRLRQQQRYRNLLDAWLYLHLPLSIALLILVGAHVVATFYFGAVEWPIF